jgi:hypothetical protein
MLAAFNFSKNIKMNNKSPIKKKKKLMHMDALVMCARTFYWRPRHARRTRATLLGFFWIFSFIFPFLFLFLFPILSLANRFLLIFLTYFFFTFIFWYFINFLLEKIDFFHFSIYKFKFIKISYKHIDI